MLIFPTILYRVPGPHSGPGFTYDYAGASDQAAYDALIVAGWSHSIEGAVYNHANTPDYPPESFSRPSVEPAAPGVASPADDAPPTRAELEAKANELGVKFDGRTSDALLLTRINAALGV